MTSLFGKDNGFFGMKHSIISLNKMRLAKIGTHRSDETKEKISKAFTGNKHWNWQGGKPTCKCGKLLSTRKVKTCVKCMHKSRLQENHPNWKGGISKNVHSTKEPKYKEWRTSVFSRDNWKCKIADSNCKGQLQAHHILPWCDYPELRYEINNGITLCQAHHPRKRAEVKRLSPYFQDLVSVSNVSN